MIRVDILKLETTGACNTLPHPLLSAPGAAPGRMKKSCAWQSGVCGKGSRRPLSQRRGGCNLRAMRARRLRQSRPQRRVRVLT